METEQKHYNLVWDSDSVQEFAEIFFAGMDKEPYDVQLTYLACRRKYNIAVRHQNHCFGRAIVRCEEPYLFYELVRKYEVPMDAYNSEEPLPNDAMVIYCTLNPRHTLKAWSVLNIEVTKLMVDSALTCGEPSDKLKKIDSLYKNALHVSRSKKKYFELDVDTKDPSVVKKIEDFLETNDLVNDKICTIETHGGYHIVFDTDVLGKDGRCKIHKEFTKPEYKERTTNINGNAIYRDLVEISSDPCCPIPGTIQGGFKVRFIIGSIIS